MKKYKLFFMLLILGIQTADTLASDMVTGSNTQVKDVAGISADSVKLKREPTENEKKYYAAYCYLNGINTKVNHPKALMLFTDLAAQGERSGMNALAGMYKQGFGMPAPQPEKARHLYEQAAELGSGKAAYNLALMWKSGQGGEQDFGKAFEYAQKSLDSGNPNALYMLGYFYYKGLGTEQSYAKAVEMFSRGAELKHVSCVYFLGFCYLGGHGVTKDIARGKQLVEQAAALGGEHAVEFIVKGRLKKYEQPPEYQPKYRTVENTADAEILQGVWQGQILHYDYGRQQVEETQSLTLQLAQDENGELTGLWVQSDSISMTVKTHKTDSLYRLEDMQYLKTWDRTYNLQSLHLAVETKTAGDTVLYGNLVQFSPQTMEPSVPVMIELRKTNINKGSADENRLGVQSLLNTIKVYPNPFEQDMELHISLQTPQRAVVQIFDLTGKAVYTETCDLNRGNQTKKISLPNLPEGAYAVSVKSAAVNLQTLVLRKP